MSRFYVISGLQQWGPHKIERLSIGSMLCVSRMFGCAVVCATTSNTELVWM
jgi:hypothetical protein